ncbi:MAG TPA: NAD(P)-dependent oxidoreductase [Solirubrobacteraceae bacterium]|jgi:nucleoside-diphosphate-sugar epimerase
MRVLVAGATGAIGRILVPRALDAGHDVVALSRSKHRLPSGWDVEHHSVDVLDGDKVASIVKQTRPDAIVDLLTAIPSEVNPKRLATDFADTNRLRTLGTAHLLRAARDAGVGQYVGESIAFVYRPAEGLAAESDPVWGLDAPREFRPVLEAVYAKEKAIQQHRGIVLRLGHLCGPGTAFGDGGAMFRAIKDRRLPIVGNGGGTFSFLPVQEAAEAFLLALPVEGPAILNVVDNAPVTAREWIPALADDLGAKKPSRVPSFVARAFIGSYGVMFMTRMRGADNAAARERLGWTPKADWRTAMLGSGGAPGPVGSGRRAATAATR